MTLQATLADMLRAIDDDARRMDANANGAHKLVEEIRRSLRPPTSDLDDQLAATRQPAYHAFEDARVAENDAYEVYADDLALYEKRRRQNLSLAQLDEDKLTVVRRRRAYIDSLRAFQTRMSAVLAVYAGDQVADGTEAAQIRHNSMDSA